MSASGSEIITAEEKLVAELELLGIRYLSRQTPYRSDKKRSPETLLADLVRQPSGRVRAAVIAVSLPSRVRKRRACCADAAAPPPERLTLQSFYLAAVFLQPEHAHRLRPFLASRWR